MPDDIDLPPDPTREQQFSPVGKAVALFFYAGFLIWFGLIVAGLWRDEATEREIQLASPKETVKASPPPEVEGQDDEAPVELVWLNTISGVYHFPGSRWYGHTASGKYLSEADAVRKGGHPALVDERPDRF